MKKTTKKSPVEKLIATVAAEETAFDKCRTCGKPASELKGAHKGKAMRVHEQACAKKAAAAKAEPATAPAKGKATKKASKATKPAKGAKAAKTTGVPREFSKKAIIIGLIERKGGATLAELMAAASWQIHSVRGFISTLGKTRTIESTKNDAGERCYAAKA